MPTISNLRFQKTDQYSAIFIVNQKQEPSTYKTLTRYANKLSKKYEDSFLPIYNSEQYNYSTIRFKKSFIFEELEPNDVVSIDFAVRRAATNKRSVYCELKSMCLTMKATPDDVIEFSDSD